MKTKNNVQKAITKSMAVIISLVLISITVNAQEFWKTILTGDGFSHLAYAMTETETMEAEADYNSWSAATADLTAMINTEEESSLEVESWMEDSENFFHEMIRINESEEDLELESWMTNESVFAGMESSLEVETEESLELENWMTNDASFRIRTILVMDENEPMLRLEGWMVDERIWKI